MDFGFMSHCALESVKCNKNEDLIINKKNPFNEKKIESGICSNVQDFCRTNNK